MSGPGPSSRTGSRAVSVATTSPATSRPRLRTSSLAAGSFYWEVVAGSFVSQGRSFAQLSAYAEAGIERYLIEAVLGRAHHRGLPVPARQDASRVGVGAADLRAPRGRARVCARPRSLGPRGQSIRRPAARCCSWRAGGQRTAVTEVTRSGFGSRDDRGEFGRSLTEQQLLDLGISFPPYHGLCRTTTVADV